MYQSSIPIQSLRLGAVDELRSNSDLQSLDYSVPVVSLLCTAHKFQVAAKEPGRVGRLHVTDRHRDDWGCVFYLPRGHFFSPVLKQETATLDRRFSLPLLSR